VLRNVVFISVVLALSSIGARAQQPDARKILARVASVYASCQRYYDEGTISDADTSRKSSFRTTFERPSKFTFEVWVGENSTDRETGWLVWKDGEVVKSWSPRNSTMGQGAQPLDVSLMLIVAPSSGSSLIVPPLLNPALVRTADVLTLVEDWKVTGEERIDSHKTILIEGTLYRQPVKLWVDQSRYLIRRFFRQNTTFNYKPKLDRDVSDEKLTIRPPTDRTTPLVDSGSLDLSSSSSKPLTDPPVLRPRSRAFGFSLSRASGQNATQQGKNSDTDDDVVRVDTDLVVSEILVVNRDGRIVTGLSREDFVIREDGNLQEVASFTLGDNKDVPRSIVLIIDYSGSQLPYIKTSIEAAKMLVDKLNPKDRMALVTDDVKLLIGFTGDKNLLKAELESLKTSALSGEVGSSYQYDSLMATLNELFDSEDSRSIVIFQTDGDQLNSLKGQTPVARFFLPRKYSLQDIINSAEKARATVYSVVSGVSFVAVPEAEMLSRARAEWENYQNAVIEMRRARKMRLPLTNAPPPSDNWLKNFAKEMLRMQTSLTTVSKSTGAWAEFLEHPSQADEIYTRILRNIELRYVIGHYPTNRLRDGQRRSVKIEVRNHPEYIVVGQRSYYARD
jgi:VWFA-related protein